jgi:hypothetical protein
LDKVDMLPRIRYRTLIVRDLAPIFGAHEDDLLKSLGILTRALDGERLETDSGVYGQRGYKGDYLFMLLAGATPISPRVFKVMGNLGSRLFFLSLHAPVKTEEELIQQNRGGHRRQKESACQKATGNFLRGLWAENPNGVDWNPDADSVNCMLVIARCAKLLAALRGAIHVWHSDEAREGFTHNVPVIEQPDRINCLLYNLARGHALVAGRRDLIVDDLAPILEVTFDSAPTIRAKVFRALIDNGGILTTSDVANTLRCSPPTARREMEALCVLGIAVATKETGPANGRPETEIKLANDFAWFAGDECRRFRWTQDGRPFNPPLTPPASEVLKEIPPCVAQAPTGAPASEVLKEIPPCVAQAPTGTPTSEVLKEIPPCVAQAPTGTPAEEHTTPSPIIH